VIEITHLEKEYVQGGRRITALRDVNLQIGRGEVFGIIGRSGAGKSSLLRTLNLLERPSRGSIKIDGQEITQLNTSDLQTLRQTVGMVFQHFNLLSAKTVAQNIEFPLKLSGKYSATERAARVLELLELVDLVAHADHYPAQLSGGQKQRVGIARALATYPRLLLCDEATSALDPETTQAILRLLLDINQKLGLTIVLITHEMQVIRSICDRVAVLEAGEIVEQGNVVDVFLHPNHAVTQSLVAENQVLDLTLLADLAQGKAGRENARLLRLTYVGHATHEPVLNRIAKQTAAEITILQGVIARIKHTPYGQLVIEVRGDDQHRVMALLQEANVRVEQLNYLIAGTASTHVRTKSEVN
jgi:D-methionine transport system ATP-binding protein